MSAIMPSPKLISAVYDVIDSAPGITKSAIVANGISASSVTKALDILLEEGIITASDVGVKSKPIKYSSVFVKSVQVIDISCDCFAYYICNIGKSPKKLSSHLRTDSIRFKDNLSEFLSRMEIDGEYVLILPQNCPEITKKRVLDYIKPAPFLITDRNSAASNGLKYVAKTERFARNVYLEINRKPFLAASGYGELSSLFDLADPGLILCENLKTVREVYSSASDSHVIIRATAPIISALTALYRPDSVTLFSDEIKLSDSDVSLLSKLSAANLPPDISNTSSPLPILMNSHSNPRILGAAGLLRAKKLADFLQSY